eukprot:5946087-Pyramimonas_sp.AAC.1
MIGRIMSDSVNVRTDIYQSRQSTIRQHSFERAPDVDLMSIGRAHADVCCARAASPPLFDHPFFHGDMP